MALIKRLKRISINDDIYFEYNYQALNACFGTNFRETLREGTWNTRDGCYAWFPHKAKMENGKYVSTSTDSNWKNYFLDDGEIIIQMLYEGEYANNNGKEPELKRENMPLYAFMKVGNKEYRYVGTFLQDYNYSTPRYHVSRRIKDNIDLSIWESGHNTDYFDVNEIGKDVFKEFYIEHSYKKHKAYVIEFLKSENTFTEDEKVFNTTCKDFKSKYGIQKFGNMDQQEFVREYLPALSNVIKGLFKKSFSVSDLEERIVDAQDYCAEVFRLITEREVSINDKIKQSKWGEELTACIFTIYDSTGEEFLYTLDEKTVERMLFAIGIEYDEADTFLDKTGKLYFWRYCDSDILEWPVYKYYCFLSFMAKIKRPNIQYISSAKPDLRKRIIREVEQQEEEIAEFNLQEAPGDFEYKSKPREREIIVDAKAAKNGCMVPRHIDRKINALVRANYCCEIDKNHLTFKRRNSEKNYTETHHLIPLEFSGEFRYTLDTEENIVSLCSNCHNQIHYGAGAEVLIKKLFEERKEALRAAGIGTTINGIEVDLEQLLHMYGIDL